MSACNHAFEERDPAEETASGDQPRARPLQKRAGPQHREMACLPRGRIMIRRRTPLRQDVDEQPIGGRLAAPPAHPELVRDRGQIHERAFAPDVVAGLAPQLAPQFLDRSTMAQHVHFEPAFVRRRVQAAQVAAGPLTSARTWDPCPPGARSGMAARRDNRSRPRRKQVCRSPPPDWIETTSTCSPPAPMAFSIGPVSIAGELMPASGAACRAIGASHGARTSGRVIALNSTRSSRPALRFPPQPRRMDVARVRERPSRPGAKQRAAIPGEHVGDGLLTKVFHHVGEKAGDVVREPFEVAGEPREPLLVRFERERVEQLRPAPVVHGQPGARYDECPPRRHQMPSPVMRS